MYLMKRTWILVLVSLLATPLFMGCETVTISRSEAAPLKQIEVFRDGKQPKRKFHDLGVLTDEGSLGEQGAIEEKFVKAARRSGADAIVLAPLSKVGEEIRGLGLVDTYLYKATMVAYEP